VSQPLPISASVDVAAPPDRVWAVVSDVTRMPEWSPELRRLYPVGGREPRVGMRLIGVNRRGYALWPTTSTVVRLEPERAVAWKTRQSGATWTYELEPTAAGTRLTGRRELAKYTLGTALFAPVIGGAAGHDRELADGIRSTLDRIKTTIEAADQL
jgi:uncharacterized protein YndB with AHSA1/START domain